MYNTLIVDGSNLLHRCYWINSKQNLDLGEVFIFLKTLKTYIKKFESTSCFVCMDKKLLFPSTNFRKDLIEVDYKGNRPDSEDIYKNEDILSSILNSLGIKVMFPRTLEADDVMAWLSTSIIGNKLIITNDADMLQMVSEDTAYFNPLKNQIIDILNFEHEVGINHNNYLMYKCIIGDNSDNIKGWYGYGPVKTKKFIERINKDPGELIKISEENKLILERNTKIIDLKNVYKYCDSEEFVSYQDQLNQKPMMQIKLFEDYCEKYNFKDFLKNISEWEHLFDVDLLSF